MKPMGTRKSGAARPPMRARPTDIADFPRGAAAGECLHRLFELADFTAAEGWPAAIARALAERPAPGAAGTRQADAGDDVASAGERDRDGAGRVRRPRSGRRAALHGVESVRDGGNAGDRGAAGPATLSLSTIARDRRLTELEFMLSARSFDLQAMTRVLLEHGYPNLVLDVSTLHGYLRGFIDLVFEYRGRVLDRRLEVDHLGDTEDGIWPRCDGRGDERARLCAPVADLLRRAASLSARRIADYDYDRHFGAALYLFIRGGAAVLARRRPARGGVHRDRPSRALIERFDALLEGGR
ncbi:MAG: hypothetical protein WDN30_15715 [Pararobbsia sp.]